MNREQMFLLLGGIGAFLSVALGAFGAHTFKSMLGPELLSTFETAVRYQMYHSLALIALGVVLTHVNHRNLIVSGWLFVWGIVLFSGSLYVLALTSARWLGIITPMGGTLFLAGWVFFVVGIVKGSQSRP